MRDGRKGETEQKEINEKKLVKSLLRVVTINDYAKGAFCSLPKIDKLYKKTLSYYMLYLDNKQ